MKTYYQLHREEKIEYARLSREKIKADPILLQRERNQTKERVYKWRAKIKLTDPEKYRLLKKADNIRSRAYFVKNYFGLSMKQYKLRIKYCKNCEQTEKLVLHHVNGKDDNNKLVCLCVPCHRQIHGGEYGEF